MPTPDVVARRRRARRRRRERSVFDVAAGVVREAEEAERRRRRQGERKLTAGAKPSRPERGSLRRAARERAARQRRGKRKRGGGGLATVVPLTGVSPKFLRGAGRVARALAVETPRAIIERPGPTLGATAGQAMDALLGIANIPVSVVKDPAGAAKKAPGAVARIPKDVVADVARRYGPVVESGDFKAFRRRAQREGVLPEVIDATIVGAVAGKTAGAVAKSGVAGKKARRLVTEPRARKRHAPGVTRAQRGETAKLAPNIARVITQKRRDVKRERAEARRDRKARQKAAKAQRRGQEPVGARSILSQDKRRVGVSQLVRERQALTRLGRVVDVRRDKKGRVRSVLVGRKTGAALAARLDQSLKGAGFQRHQHPGGSLEYFAPRVVVGRRGSQRRSQRVEVARPKGQAVQTIRTRTSESHRQFDRTTGTRIAQALRRGGTGLSRLERSALFYAHTLGVRRPEHLDLIAKHIREGRAERDFRPSRFEGDELKLVRVLKENFEEAFTPRLVAAVEGTGGTRELVRRSERENPTLKPVTAEAARVGPQAQLLGVERRVVPVERFDAEATAKLAGRLERGTARDARVLQALDRRIEELEASDAPVAREALGRLRAERDRRARRVQTATAVRARLAEPGVVRAGRELREAPSERFERVGDFTRRVREEGRSRGLATPGFAPSEKTGRPKFWPYTAGGSKAPQKSKPRLGTLQRLGVQRATPEVVFEGIQRNIRAGVTAKLVADTFERIAHPRYRNMEPRELLDAIRREGYDLSEVAVWFPGLFRREAQRRTEAEAGAYAQGFRTLDDLEELTPLGPALEAASPSLGELAEIAERGHLVPRASLEEMRSLSAETATGRAWDRIRTWQSRSVLGAGNVAWVIADTVTNTALAAGLAGVGPVKWFMAKRVYNALDDSVKRRVAQELDIGPTRSQTHRPHLGVTAANNSLVNYYRGIRESPFGRKARPIQWSVDQFLRLERGVANDPQRRRAFVVLARKEAFRRLDQEVGLLNGLLARVESVFGRDPKGLVNRMLKDRDALESVARQVEAVLGDWSTLTRLERMTVNRATFFYPYMRFSLKLAFATMPLNHPVRFGIVANLALLTNKEQRELLGADPDDINLLSGRYFFRGPDGRIYEYGTRTINPVGNGIVEAEDSAAILSLPPPVLGMALAQIQKRKVFGDRSLRVRGQATNPVKGPEFGSGAENLETRLRVLTKEALDLPPVTRLISKWLLPGEQGDDALPLSPRPIQFKSPKRIAQAERKREITERPGLAGLGRLFLENQLRLFVAKPSDIEDVLERRRRNRPKQDQKRQPRDFVAAPSGRSRSTGERRKPRDFVAR